MLGYNKLAINNQLVLDLAAASYEGPGGDRLFDRSAAHHECLLHGITIAWTVLVSGLPVLTFTAATPDWVDCGALATADLDFTTEDFSACAWIYTTVTGVRYLLCRGVNNTDGWAWAVEVGAAPVQMTVVTNQAAANQFTQSLADITLNTWHFVSFSRSDAVVRTFRNGVDNTETAGIHVDPLTANRELHIGIDDTEAAGMWNGSIWRPRIWCNRYIEEWEWKQIFEKERHWFGV